MNLALTIFLMLTPQLIFGQFRNIILDDDNGGRPPAEPSIAINPKNPDNIVAGAILDKLYTTFDGGRTWTRNRLESPYGVWGDPALMCDLDGTFYYFHLSDPTGTNWQSEEILDRIVVQTSEDGGLSWSKGSYMGLNPPKDQDKQWATFEHFKGDLYVTWTQFDKYGSEDPAHKTNILFSSSSKGGKKWSKPIMINQASGDCLDGDMSTEGAMPAVGLLGEIYVVWAFNEKLWMNRSFDKGKTWLGNDLPIADQAGGWDMDIPGVYKSNGLPVLKSDRRSMGYHGSLYVLWADQRNGPDDTDIWLIRSNNRGDQWTQPIRVNSDSAGNQQFMPWLAVDQVTGYVYALFYDRREHNDHSTDVYLAYSTNGGDSFENVRINERSFTPDASVFLGDYINIDAHAGKIAAVWTEMHDESTSIVAAIFDQTELGIDPLKLPDSSKKKKKKSKKEGK